MPITNWSIRHAVTILVLMVMLVVLGFQSYQALPREAAPDITIPLVLVTTPYVGVAPADIESLVTNPLEEELEKLKDVEVIRSTSAEGASIISIEFSPSVNIDDALQKIRERIDAARPELPADAEDPIITEISFSEFPVIVVNVAGDVGLLALKQIAEDLQRDIERISGVLEVSLVGGIEREITVEADPELLAFYRVTILELLGTIEGENINLPGGSVDVGDLKYLVRVPGEFQSPAEIEALVIRMEEGQPIHVRDVARVVDGYEEESTYSRINRTQSVSLSVTRRGGENILRINDSIHALVERYQRTWDGRVTFTTLADVSEDIRAQLDELENNILTGLLLVVVVLFFFMGGFRNALFVGISIPMSMLISFIVLQVMGYTLNIVVLFSLVLALGMLVDNAIVVVENIYRHGAMGKPLVQACMDGVEEVAWPVISSTLTTVAAFLPLSFWPGIMGQFMSFMPVTVIIVLLSSLFVALVINPVLCSLFMRLPPVVPGADEEDADHAELKAIPDNFFYRGYEAVLTVSVRWWPLVLATALGAFLGTLQYFGTHSAGVEFFPETTPERAYLNITLPDGSHVEASDRVVRMVENLLVEEPDIANFVADVGAGNGDQMDFGSGGTAPHRSRITIDFVEREFLQESPLVVLERIRSRMAQISGAEFEIRKEQGGPPTAPPINIELSGSSQDELGRLTTAMIQIIRDIPGVVDLKDDFEAGRPEVRVEVNRLEAARVQVSTRDVANTVRGAINGFEASRFRENNEEYDIIVRLAQQHRNSIEDVARLEVANGDGDRIPITEVAEVVVGRGYGSIRHVDGDRVITITADVAPGFNSNEVLQQVQAALVAQVPVPTGYAVTYTGENRDQAEAQAFLGQALLMGLFLIALVLITQFNSVVQPLMIMVSVVLSLMGVLWGLLVTQQPFSVIMTGVGIISLAGVVVNNAIVLIDYTNQLRDRGMAVQRAVVVAGMVRLRPVLLTAGTTALSLLPTVLGYSLDVKNLQVAQGGTSVEMWGPMANAVVAGLAVSTFLTLLVIPAMYRGIDQTTGGLRALGAFLKTPWWRRKPAPVVEDEEAGLAGGLGEEGAPLPAE
jgi:CzcA family heavy metal efflux pump